MYYVENVSFLMRFIFSTVHLFYYKQPVYKQLALEWQIAKQLSELNKNKNHRLKKSGVFPSQPAFTCSKLTIETPEQGVKYVQS